MSEDSPERTTEARVRALIRARGKAERRLLELERRAERQLARAYADLEKAEVRRRESDARLARAREAVVAAETALRESQTRRAAGPVPPED